MSATRLEIHVEEPSMEALLNELLPRKLGDISYSIYSYQGKGSLLQRLEARMRGYASLPRKGLRIIVLLDRDSDDCQELKKRLERAALDAGLVTRASKKNENFDVATRIVIEELEAWYFGDWSAVVSAYPKIGTNWPTKAAYRQPDAIGGTWEAFERIAQKSGYFKGGLRKVEAATSIGQFLEPSRNVSPSFKVFWQVIEETVGL